MLKRIRVKNIIDEYADSHQTINFTLNCEILLTAGTLYKK